MMTSLQGTDTHRPVAVGVGVMDRLKAETSELHTQAEKMPLQHAMVTGQISREAFASFLGQLHFVHEALEKAIVDARGRCERLRVVPEEQLQHSSRIGEDLRTVGGAQPTVKINPATERVVRDMHALAASDPMALLGVHYVLEGSMNGNRYIAKAMRRGLGLEGTSGTRYLDPYGEAQREKWIGFRMAVDRLEWSGSEVEAALRGAKMMFAGMTAISAEVWG
jgi:heme oxygenase